MMDDTPLWSDLHELSLSIARKHANMGALSTNLNELADTSNEPAVLNLSPQICEIVMNPLRYIVGGNDFLERNQL